MRVLSPQSLLILTDCLFFFLILRTYLISLRNPMRVYKRGAKEKEKEKEMSNANWLSV